MKSGTTVVVLLLALSSVSADAWRKAKPGKRKKTGQAAKAPLIADPDDAAADTVEKAANAVEKAANAVDKNEACESWAAMGECDINPQFMLENCPASCASHAANKTAANAPNAADAAAKAAEKAAVAEAAVKEKAATEAAEAVAATKAAAVTRAAEEEAALFAAAEAAAAEVPDGELADANTMVDTGAAARAAAAQAIASQGDAAKKPRPRAQAGLDASLPSASVQALFFLQFGTLEADGSYLDWERPAESRDHYSKHGVVGGSERDHASNLSAPEQISAAYYPQRGLYSSGDTAVLDEQIAEMKSAGVGAVVLSLPGRPGGTRGHDMGGSLDTAIERTFDAAEAAGIRVAFLVEHCDHCTGSKTLHTLAVARLVCV